MSTGVQLLDFALVVALIVAFALWIHSLTSRSRARREDELRTKRMAHQPWDADSGGRGNR